MQFEVLVSNDPQTALHFKNARQKECETVAIAVRFTIPSLSTTYQKLILKGFYFSPNRDHFFFIK